MLNENVNIDVYCRNIERIGKKGGSVIFTLEIDDLPDAEEAEKLLRKRLVVGGAKVTVWDVGGIMAYINVQNRLIKRTTYKASEKT